MYKKIKEKFKRDIASWMIVCVWLSCIPLYYAVHSGSYWLMTASIILLAVLNIIFTVFN